MGVRAAESVVDLLLGRGAQPDVVDVRGRIALMMAAELGHAEVVEMLIGRGADPSARDKPGKTALELAADANVRRMLTTR